MSSIERFARAVFTRDNGIIACTTLMMLLLANLALMYTAPRYAHILPRDILRFISPCYRSFIYLDPQGDGDVGPFEAVFGDSFVEGSGDEWLASDPDFGLFNKLSPLDGRQFLSFARSGYGPLGNHIEEQRCQPLLESWTSFGLKREHVSHLTYVFYEGNDLNDIHRERGRSASRIKYRLRFALPIFDYAYQKLKRVIGASRSGAARAQATAADYPTTQSGIELGD